MNEISTIVKDNKEYIRQICSTYNCSDVILETGFWEATPVVYFIYPYLFSTSFGITDGSFLKELSLSGFLIYRSSIIKDRLDDNDVEVKFTQYGLEKYSEAMKECFANALLILKKYFKEDSPLWRVWQKREKEHRFSLQLDKSLGRNTTWKEYRTFSDYKSAFAKLAIDALYVYSNDIKNKNLYNTLLSAHKYFSTAIQLLDDISDIYKDYVQGQFNWSLNEVLLTGNLGTDDSENNLKKEFYIQGIALKNYKKVISELEYVKKVSQKNNCTFWTLIVLQLINKMQEQIFIYNHYINITKKKAELLSSLPEMAPVSISFQNNVPDCISKGVIGILKNRENDFLEMKHIMWLPSKEGFVGRKSTYVGEVFQRAILGCFLCDINNVTVGLNQIIDEQANIILSSTKKDNVGGWGYLLEDNNTAADADDLGQILQFFCAANKKEQIKKKCNKLISLLFNRHNSFRDGSFKTWILPEKKTKFQIHQQCLNLEKWGEGPDIEVVANCLLGIYDYNFKVYEKQIQKGCDYILANMNPNGYWESRWYYGNYYGTYVCSRLISTCHKLDDEKLSKVFSFLISSQNEDGGWGWTTKSDPLNTAFAVLTLSFFKTNTTAIKNGVKYLQDTQKENGLWDSVNFIKPRLIEPYKSKTITSIFCIKALVTVYNYE